MGGVGWAVSGCAVLLVHHGEMLAAAVRAVRSDLLSKYYVCYQMAKMQIEQCLQAPHLIAASDI